MRALHLLYGITAKLRVEAWTHFLKSARWYKLEAKKKKEKK